MLEQDESNPAGNGNKLEIKDITEIIHDVIF
jgi:hypothetical protein